MITHRDPIRSATCAPHHGQESREVIALSATGQLGMAAAGQIQLAVVSTAGHGVAPVFGRLEAFGAVQRCPDIDVLVPRAVLDAVREYARAARSGPFPVRIDASGAACFIDLRPRSEQSYLTHRRLRFPVPSDLFAPQPTWLEGVEISTIDPRVLHAFSHHREIRTTGLSYG